MFLRLYSGSSAEEELGGGVGRDRQAEVGQRKAELLSAQLAVAGVVEPDEVLRGPLAPLPELVDDHELDGAELSLAHPVGPRLDDAGPPAGRRLRPHGRGLRGRLGAARPAPGPDRETAQTARGRTVPALRSGSMAAAPRKSKSTAGRLPLTSRAFRNDQLALFYEDVCALTNSHKVLPMNSGAAAVETAIKAVRKWGYEVKGVAEDQAEVIVCEDGFHGRTITIVGFSTDPNAHGNFGPFTPGFKIIPYGDADAFEQAITPNTVAFLVEPIQGEAGVIIPPDGYHQRTLEVCRKYDVFYISDEVVTSFGRLGHWFASEEG